MQSSDQEAEAHNLQVDPENRYWWRLESRRLESEAVRDSLLYLAGNLDLAVGGPALTYPKEPGTERRSLYYRYSREDKMEFLTVFDAASTEECYRRDESIVPQQALALINGEWVWHQARCLTQRLGSVDGPAFVTGAFEAVLGRPPSNEERAACAEFLASRASDRKARERLVHVLLNHNDFVTVR
jgi:hypothetical protein